VDAADAREDQALVGFMPRVQLIGRYTRLSDFTPPPLFEFGRGSLVVTAAPPGTQNPPSIAVAFPVATFPVIVDQYLAQATLLIPVSDYFLRIAQAHTAASRGAEAARDDLIAARAKSYADGKIAYFTWLKARGSETVTRQILAAAAGRQKDAETQLAVGSASKDDVLRAETSVAMAELGVQRAKSAIGLAEQQLRFAIHAGSEKLEPGEGLQTPPPALSESLRGLVAEAHRQRPELKSLVKNAESARSLASSLRGARIPSLSAIGDVTYANPNVRRIPQSATFFPTWAAGVQITWSPSDALAGGASGADYDARAAALEAQVEATRDGIELETMQAYNAVVDGDVALVTTKRQLDSATEAHRVARSLFATGRGTGTALAAAEAALAQARFDHLNARVDARIARVRLDFAVGRHPGGVEPSL
jgi:outer membrane protein TolC